MNTSLAGGSGPTGGLVDDRAAPRVDEPVDLFGAMLKSAATSLARPGLPASEVPAPAAATPNVMVGELVGLRNDEPRALVVFPGLLGAVPRAARSVVDLHGAHIGAGVVLMFDNGERTQPIVMGVLRGAAGWPPAQRPQQVEIDADGERLLVGAQRQLVLRCGAASITLERSGKVSIRGTQIVSEAEGANRVCGGSVQLN